MARGRPAPDPEQQITDGQLEILRHDRKARGTLRRDEHEDLRQLAFFAAAVDAKSIHMTAGRQAFICSFHRADG
jgi:hypothetical protein